ncbi:MAG: hypothetical protein FDZ75_05790 [Actinobacteria bacterium]|nr:MAG: hypothetical protein FDZ75_05790 [Actinomycetota bacterium]
MSDGFDFSRPAERREPKKFEPPPWEAEAFERRARELEQAAEELQAEVGAPSVQAAEEPAAQEPQAAEPAVTTERPAQPEPEAKPEAGKLDERRVIAMLAELREEEPSDTKIVTNVSYAVALVLGAFGLVLVVWAMAAFVAARRTGALGTTGGTILLGFGGLFVGTAIWLAVRTLRQRGVL